MKTLLVVYHSMTGGARQMALAAVAGAAGEADTVQTRLLHAADAGPADLLGADAYLFATPENLASMAGVMKDFFDRAYYAVLDRLNGRAYAAMICAGSDGSNAARQLERIATGWRLKRVAETLIVCTHAQTTAEILSEKHISAEDSMRCEELGAALAGGLSLGVF